MRVAVNYWYNLLMQIHALSAIMLLLVSPPNAVFDPIDSDALRHATEDEFGYQVRDDGVGEDTEYFEGQYTKPISTPSSIEFTVLTVICSRDKNLRRTLDPLSDKDIEGWQISWPYSGLRTLIHGKNLSALYRLDALEGNPTVPDSSDPLREEFVWQTKRITELMISEPKRYKWSEFRVCVCTPAVEFGDKFSGLPTASDEVVYYPIYWDPWGENINTSNKVNEELIIEAKSAVLTIMVSVSQGISLTDGTVQIVNLTTMESGEVIYSPDEIEGGVGVFKVKVPADESIWVLSYKYKTANDDLNASPIYFMSPSNEFVALGMVP